MAKKMQKPVLPGPSPQGKGKGKKAASKPKSEADEYAEMLKEARQEAPEAFESSDRPAKRRKTVEASDYSALKPPELKKPSSSRRPPAVIDLEDEAEEREKEVFPRKRQRKRRDPTPEPEPDLDDGVSDEEDWEEVDLAPQINGDVSVVANGNDQQKSLDIILDDPARGRRPLALRKKGITAEDRRSRLTVHKIHLLCLLTHVYARSSWCDVSAVKAVLQPLLTKDMRRCLHPNKSHPQPRQVKDFMEGLRQVRNFWEFRWRVIAKGTTRSTWIDEDELSNWKPPEEGDGTMDLEDFFEAARRMSGSRDLGAQILCAFFRAAGVPARLICSLQPLPWTFKDAKPKAAQKADVQELLHTDEEQCQTEEAEPSDDEAMDITRFDDPPVNTTTRTSPSIPNPRQRLGNQPIASDDILAEPTTTSKPLPSFVTNPKLKKAIPKKTPILEESPYPVYWVEVFSAAAQSWIPVDPLATHTHAQRLIYEPPLSDPFNELSYVVAFEPGGHCRDVTRRYTKLYNAKTLKQRVEATDGGHVFWRKAISKFRRHEKYDRDQIEDVELAKWEAQEPMPAAEKDYKDHPQYALERHLRRGEALWPREPCGKVALGKAGPDGKKALEPVYRRRCVKAVKSAETWFRVGRVVRDGEQPLKVLKPVRLSRRQQERLPEGEESTHGLPVELFAEFQTVLYEAPPVVQGIVPRNAYGNIDIYAPNMVPPGGVHILEPDAVTAAKMLGIDYAEAVVGFEFRGRSGFPILKGCVVAVEHQGALFETVDKIRVGRRDADIEVRTKAALAMWKKMIVALKVAEKVEGIEIEGAKAEEEAQNGSTGEGEDEGGGFMREDDEGGGGFMPDASDEDGGGGFVPEDGDEDVADQYMPDAEDDQVDPDEDNQEQLSYKHRPAISSHTHRSKPAVPTPLFASALLTDYQATTSITPLPLSRQATSLAAPEPAATLISSQVDTPSSSPDSETEMQEQLELFAALEANQGEGDEGLEPEASPAEVLATALGASKEGDDEEDEETGSRASHDPDDDLMDAEWAI